MEKYLNDKNLWTTCMVNESRENVRNANLHARFNITKNDFIHLFKISFLPKKNVKL